MAGCIETPLQLEDLVQQSLLFNKFFDMDWRAGSNLLMQYSLVDHMRINMLEARYQHQEQVLANQT